MSYSQSNTEVANLRRTSGNPTGTLRLPAILNHSLFYSMTAVTNLRTFADLSKDANKDPFGTLATAAKRAAYEKLYAHFNVDSDNGTVPEAVLIFTALEV